MAYINRPYGNNYYEVEKEVVREGPYGSAYGSAEYRIDEYGNRVHHHRNGLGNVVTEVVSEVIPGHHHHPHNHHNHQYGRPAEIIERREERIIDNSYDPYRVSFNILSSTQLFRLPIFERFDFYFRLKIIFSAT